MPKYTGVQHHHGTRTWRAQKNGQRIRKSGFATAEDAAHDRTQTLATLQPATFTTLTVAQWLTMWLDQTQVEPHTRRQYENIIRKHLIPEIGDHQLRKLAPIHIATLYANLTVAPKTCRNIHSVLHHALETAVADQILTSNPARPARRSLPKLKQHAMTIWTPQELRNFVEWLNRQEHVPSYVHVATVLGGYTGLRCGEMAALTWRDINLRTTPAELTVSHVIPRQEKRRRPYGKTDRARRTLDLGSQTAKMLRQWRQQQMAETGREEFVLTRPAPYGGMVSLNHLGLRFGQWVDRWVETQIDVPQLRLHGLRHTHASHLLHAGKDLLRVARRLGHADEGFTLRRYGWLVPGESDCGEAAEGLSSWNVGSNVGEQ